MNETCSCGTPVSASAKFCPSCGKSKPGEESRVQSGGMQENLVGLLCYITFIPAVIFLLLEPYNKNRFVRFHAFQSIFFSVAVIIINVGIQMVGSFMSVMALILLPIDALLGIGVLILWIVCLVKAFNHETFKLPIIGEMAEQQAGKI